MTTKNNRLPSGYLLQSQSYTYRIESVLGSGGFGITYLATAKIKVGNVSARVKFAIKEHFMSSDCEREPDTSRVVYSNPAKERVENAKKDFIAEARRLRSVDHHHLVKVNEVFEANNTAYYVMEYLDGESLCSRVRRNGALPEEQMLSIMNPIIEAVQYLHANRMTHLDIKPDNIMLTQDDNDETRPVLIDFGLSKHYDKDGKPTSTINTLGCSDGYAPIEQYAGITTFSPTADVYALGATMWFCLMGKDPKKSTDLEEAELANGLIQVSAQTRVIIQKACVLNRFNRQMPPMQESKPLTPPGDPPREHGGSNVTKHIADDDTIKSNRYVLFPINGKWSKTLWAIAAIYIVWASIFAHDEYCGWYYGGLDGTFMTIGILATFILSIYGLTMTKQFVESKKIKFTWALSIATFIASECYNSDVSKVFNYFCLYSIIIICYEAVTNLIPWFTQLIFMFAILVSAFLYTIYQ
ncbi:MAG: serine/threonine protein kinase [Prevotellaceae bacterium]|jgi:serine/threonine protein kinase|nr:serine/threonine protein kinase [Prevotellaceae bacterium]